MINGTKLICINPFYHSGKDYEIGSVFTIKKNINRWVSLNEIHAVFVHCEKEEDKLSIWNYFIPLADWREQQINNILND